jgi:hypothetical protein
MEYAAFTLAAMGFAAGLLFRLHVLLLLIALTLLCSIVICVGSSFSFFYSFLAIMAVQTVLQGSYFLGLMAHAVLTANRSRHIF